MIDGSQIMALFVADKISCNKGSGKQTEPLNVIISNLVTIAYGKSTRPFPYNTYRRCPAFEIFHQQPEQDLLRQTTYGRPFSQPKRFVNFSKVDKSIPCIKKKLPAQNR